MSFDTRFARDTVLPLAEQAYGWTGAGAIQPGGFGFVSCSLKTCLPTGTTTISFRGTQDQNEWLKDFNAVPVPNFYGSGHVHKGFQEVYTSIRPSLLDLVGTNATPVLITGHSLGGALAVICAADLVRGGWTPTVYTWAGPRVGHEDFAAWFNSVVPACYRIVNKWDIVPHLPLTAEKYVHVGQEILIDGGQPKVFLDSSLEALHLAHNLEKSYRPGMDWLLAQEQHG